uniref:Uncharacterized protein n=1 Tax=Glossina austeni TaxID=7395 RepID=A0A1A9UNS9_GLOAU
MIYTRTRSAVGGRPNSRELKRGTQESCDIAEEKIKNVGIKIEGNFNSRINDLRTTMKLMKNELNRTVRYKTLTNSDLDDKAAYEFAAKLAEKYLDFQRLVIIVKVKYLNASKSSRGANNKNNMEPVLKY